MPQKLHQLGFWSRCLPRSCFRTAHNVFTEGELGARNDGEGGAACCFFVQFLSCDVDIMCRISEKEHGRRKRVGNALGQFSRDDTKFSTLSRAIC